MGNGNNSYQDGKYKMISTTIPTSKKIGSLEPNTDNPKEINTLQEMYLILSKYNLVLEGVNMI